MPEVTVLMAVHNGEPYLRVALESVLAQTYRDFTLLVVDDASSDRTVEMIRSYADSRIQLVVLDHNVGQTAALNIGLHLVQTPWIARMDADDFSAPTRLERQMAAASRTNAIGCVGTYAWTFSDNPETRSGLLTKPVGNAAIQAALLWSAPLIHGSLLVRAAAMREIDGYDERYRYSADLELYDRLLMHTQADNIPEPLLGIRWHPAQDSRSVKALDETLEIFERRLSTGRYSAGDLAVVRAGRYLHLALRARRLSQPLALLKNFSRAFWCCPSLTASHLLPRSLRAA